MYNRVCPLGDSFDQMLIPKLHQHFLADKREFKIEGQILYFVYEDKYNDNDENILASNDLLGRVQEYI